MEVSESLTPEEIAEIEAIERRSVRSRLRARGIEIKDYYTVPELVEILGWGEVRIYRMVRKGLIVAYRGPRDQVRVTPKYLDALLARIESEGTVGSPVTRPRKRDARLRLEGDLVLRLRDHCFRLGLKPNDLVRQLVLEHLSSQGDQ